MLALSTQTAARSARLPLISRAIHFSAPVFAGPSALEARLRDGLKSAMKSRDRQAATAIKVMYSSINPLSAFSMTGILPVPFQPALTQQSVLADATNAAKAGPNPNEPATESAVITALRKGIDKRKEAAEIYAPSSPSPSPEQHSTLTTEIDLLSTYLPQSPSAESLSALVTEVIECLSAEVRAGKGAMGPAMKGILEKLGEAAAAAVDRKEIGRLVQEALKR